jgi:S1-C subfamily serine protease
VRRALALCVLAAAAAAAGLAFARGTAASAEAGVVVVETNLALQNSAGAATGMVLTPSGEVLTNNHVIRGATTIRVTVPASRRTYRARVVGYSVAADVAVLRLAGASGLQTVSLGDSSRLRVGQQVTAVGNAGGTSTLTRASGRIIGLGRTITASDDQGGVERLTGLIETTAQLRPGDSGGPLLDAARRVIGMDTAASTGFVFRSGANEGFAIPIARALTIRKQISAGRASGSVHIGATALLGVRVGSADGLGSAPGVLVTGVVPGSPAERAGLEPDDVITVVDGRAVQSPQALTALILRHAPGDAVRVAWSDAFGDDHAARVTLASGPPQ